MTKPILKWVGGKTQILEEVLSKFPKVIHDYHEIFIGGGSVLIGLLESDIEIKGSVYAYDINETLINLYKNIQSKHLELYDLLMKITEEYNSRQNMSGNKKPTTYEDSMDSKESYYYWIRLQYNHLPQNEKNSVIGSAMFIFLNKTCFRGLFRVGPNGFNVPFGNYKNPEIINLEHLEKISILIQRVIFRHMTFEESLSKNTNLDDFVYLDPPYVPETKTSFSKYSDDIFDDKKHDELFVLTKSLKCNFLMSNSYTQKIIDSFPSSEFDIAVIECKRTINSKDPNSKTKEVLISKNELDFI